jgi:DNA (cytosine-5)-methyltransferase 1
MRTVELSRGEVIDRIDELLEARYHSADLGNLDEPLAETVFILLSQQTRDAVYRGVYQALREAFPRWMDARRARVRTLERVLEPAGFHRRRARQLRALLARVDQSNRERRVGPYGPAADDLTLDFLHDLEDAEAEEFLLGLPGIGPKSARCVLAYALGRGVFPVDTHVHRILSRLELLPTLGRKADHDPFQDAIPVDMRKRLHVNLVHHGREICRTSNERCGDCVLVSFCRPGQRRLSCIAEDQPVAIDLFAGAGGLGSGFRAAGFRIGLAVEPDRHAAQTYRLNNPGVPVIEAHITGKTRAASLRRYLPGVRIRALLAGTPCQGYSAAGARRPESPVNRLYVHVGRLARQLKVDLLILENVPGVRRVNGHPFLEPIRSCLEADGMAVAPYLLRASDFGVPQRRLRYFFLGRRDRRRRPPSAPQPTHRRRGQLSSLDPGLPQTQTVAEVLAQLPVVGPGVDAERLVLEDGTELFNLSTMRHSPEVIDKIAEIAPGEGPISYRRLTHTEAPTLIAGHRALPVHPDLDRTISAREAALLQGFPIDYIFLGPRGDQPLQVANAVPPPLAEAIARHLRSSLLDP